jgi:1-acyl-sn-glycerol-3-phosphate acyltransferase
MKKFAQKTLDWTVGLFFRWLMIQLARPYVLLKHPVTVKGGDAALSCKESGGIILAEHHSMMDGVLLMVMAWPYARIRPTAKYAQYTKWYFWLVMVAFSVIRLGSPRHWPSEKREAEKRRGLETMSKVIGNGWLLLLFPAGIIRTGEKEVIDPRFTAAYTQIQQFPEKPVLLLRHRGLHASEDRGFFRRCPVHIELTRVDNVSLEGGPAGLNKRLELFFNEGVPLAQNKITFEKIQRS